MHGDAGLSDSYDDLKRRAFVLRSVDGISADDLETLVERTYEGTPQAEDALAARLEVLARELDEQTRSDAQKARSAELGSPFEELDPWSALSQAFEDEDPKIHASLRARTRLGPASVDVIPVVRRGTELVSFTSPELRFDYEVKDPLSRSTVLALARQSLSVSRPGITHALIASRVPKPFELSGHLRFHRALELDERGFAELAGVPIFLSPDLGLAFGDEAKAALEEMA
ncbi:MAG: hypothetical protein HYV07_02230 [Deltaproteobacteria bacterium]|nr:hypothetical protein [Deltaproteobacteria bacterium]